MLEYMEDQHQLWGHRAKKIGQSVGKQGTQFQPLLLMQEV